MKSSPNNSSSSPDSRSPDSSLHWLYFIRLWEQKGLALLGISLAVLTAYSGIALLAVSGWFISAAALAGLSISAAHAFNFFTPGAMVRGLSISRTAGRYAERLSTHEATFSLIAKLRADLFRRISRQSWVDSPFDRHDLSSKLLKDIDHIEHIYSSALVPMIVSASVALAYMLTLWFVCPTAFVWTLPCLISASLLMPLVYSSLVLKLEMKKHILDTRSWQQAHSFLGNLRILTLFGQRPFYSQDLENQCKHSDTIETQALQRQRLALLGTQFILVLMTLVAFWKGVDAFSKEQLEGAYLFMILLLSLGTVDVLLASCPAFASLCLGWSALNRIEASTAFDKGSDSHVHADTIKHENAKHPLISPYIKISHLHYRYPNNESYVFKDFNCQVSKAGWIWLKGKSGCGKSTLLHLISGFLSPESGQIECSPRISLMPQRIDILRANLRQNLCLNLELSDQEVWQALELVELADWGRSLPEQLDTWLGDGEWQVSGGEAKRIGLARAILQKGSILLLDEPFAGIDTELASKLQQNLSSHFKDQIVIVSSHESLGQEKSQQLILPVR